MEELVMKEVRDGDQLLHDVCKVLHTSVWLNSSDEPLMTDQLHVHFSGQVASLKWINDRFN